MNTVTPVLTKDAATAAKINDDALKAIDAKEYIFTAHLWSGGEGQRSRYNLERELRLKVGSQVLYLRDVERTGFDNGLLATIIEIRLAQKNGTSIPDDIVVIQTRDGQTIEVAREVKEDKVFRKSGYGKNQIHEEYSLGGCAQFPLIPGHAFSYTQSQGLLFDVLIIANRGKYFGAGELHSFLSRCISLDGLILQVPIKKEDIKVSTEFLRYYRKALKDKRYLDVWNGVKNGKYKIDDEA
jgi:hypothetical protein